MSLRTVSRYWSILDLQFWSKSYVVLNLTDEAVWSEMVSTLMKQCTMFCGRISNKNKVNLLGLHWVRCLEQMETLCWFLLPTTEQLACFACTLNIYVPEDPEDSLRETIWQLLWQHWNKVYRLLLFYSTFLSETGGVYGPRCETLKNRFKLVMAFIYIKQGNQLMEKAGNYIQSNFFLPKVQGKRTTASGWQK